MTYFHFFFLVQSKTIIIRSIRWSALVPSVHIIGDAGDIFQTYRLFAVTLGCQVCNTGCHSRIMTPQRGFNGGVSATLQFFGLQFLGSSLAEPLPRGSCTFLGRQKVMGLPCRVSQHPWHPKIMKTEPNLGVFWSMGCQIVRNGVLRFFFSVGLTLFTCLSNKVYNFRCNLRYFSRLFFFFFLVWLNVLHGCECCVLI